MYRQGYEYYWKTHACPGSTFKYTTSSLLDLMRGDATDQIELIYKPLLMMAGSKTDTLYMTEDAFTKATGTKDKELFKIHGANPYRNLLGSKICGRCYGSPHGLLWENPVTGFERKEQPAKGAIIEKKISKPNQKLPDL